MHAVGVSEPADHTRANEDWMYVSPELIIVLDGTTARTDTGCVHSIAWYTMNLGQALAKHALSSDNLTKALAQSIADVAGLHPQCDLSHPGTPAAMVGAVHFREPYAEYLVLGDVTALLDIHGLGLKIVIDDRVDNTARFEREEADRFPIGSPEKQAALIRMKHAELTLRNTSAGYYVAASDPSVAAQAISGTINTSMLERAALLSDGLARAVSVFGFMRWPDVLELLGGSGPRALIERVREAEAADPAGIRWSRNKTSDDATAIYATAELRR